MKNLKKYEMFNTYSVLSKLVAGDYVIINPKRLKNVEELYVFLNNNIGQILHNFSDKTMNVYYIDIPKNLRLHFLYQDHKGYYRKFKYHEIEYASKDKGELETILASKKFNL